MNTDAKIKKLCDEVKVCDFEVWEKLKTQEEWDSFIMFYNLKPDWDVPVAETFFYYFKMGLITGKIMFEKERLNDKQ